MIKEGPVVSCDGFTFLIRREKLKVGSEWLCVADNIAERVVHNKHCISYTRINWKNEVVVFVEEVHDFEVVFAVNGLKFVTPKDQFLLCNKPKEG